MGKGGWEVQGVEPADCYVQGECRGLGVLEGSCPSLRTPGPAADAELRHGGGTQAHELGSGSWLVIRAGAVVATPQPHTPTRAGVISSPELCAFLAASRPSCAEPVP